MDLVPFDLKSGFQVGVLPQFGKTHWELTYEVNGPIQELVWDRSLNGQAQDLWKQTCMELFVSIGPESYMEWNGSPSGAWSIIQFSGYRNAVPYSQRGDNPVLKSAAEDPQTLRLVWTLPVELFPGVDLTQAEISLNAVIFSRPTNTSAYFALKHASSVPDFHNRAAWIKVKEEWVEK